ncbi:MAG: DUF6505 family protein [Paracoccus sp. (in: a-proteobacteria)]|nr:DUF6505 family protein [Paracoccus sp. (in: a-proteobacteria)]
MMLLRTIRLDASDAVIFAPAAAPGEWAVPGTFLFAGRDPASLDRKQQIAFRSGFLGVESFGHSTLACVTPATEAERDAAIEALARGLVAHLGAPDLATARPAASEEIMLAADLCRGQGEGRLIALHRGFEDGQIHERFRSLRPRDETLFGGRDLAGHDRAFHIVESDEEDGPALSLADLAGQKGGADA